MLHQCEVKGPTDEYILDRTVRDVNDAGYRGVRLVLKSDQEHAIVSFAEQVAVKREGETVPMVSPQGDPASNGEVENWIGRCKGQLRTIKLATEANLGLNIIPGHPLWDWMVLWSSQLINRYRVDEEGYTAIQRVRGRRCRKPLCLFGEFVHWKPASQRA